MLLPQKLGSLALESLGPLGAQVIHLVLLLNPFLVSPAQTLPTLGLPSPLSLHPLGLFHLLPTPLTHPYHLLPLVSSISYPCISLKHSQTILFAHTLINKHVFESLLCMKKSNYQKSTCSLLLLELLQVHTLLVQLLQLLHLQTCP